MGNWFINKLAAFLNKEVEPKMDRALLTDFERLCEEIRPLDVLLVEGRSRVSNIIKTVTCSPWTHAALYIGRMDDIKDGALQNKIAEYYRGDHRRQLLVEALLDEGTTIKPLDKYKGEHLRICRPNGLSKSDRQKAVAFALSHLGFAYDVRHLLDLARFLFPYAVIPRRWRSTLFTRRPGQTTKTVCSYMLGEVFASINFPILPVIERLEGDKFKLYKRNTKLLTPSDFDYSPYFDIIKYPFLSLDEIAAYRLLPWDQEMILNGAEDLPRPPQAEEATNSDQEAASCPADRTP